MLRGMLTPVRRLGDAVERGLDVVRGQFRAVVELHALAQMERVGLAVLGDLPAMRQVGDDRLAAVARIAPDQVVEHAALRAEVVDRARLVHVEMRRAHRDAVCAARRRDFGLGSGAASWNFEPSNSIGNVGGPAEAPATAHRRPPPAAAPLFRKSRRFHRGRAARGSVMTFPPLWLFSGPSTACSDGAQSPQHQNNTEIQGVTLE